MAAAGVAGRDLGVPVRHHDVVPVNVVAFAPGTPVPRVVKGVQVRVDAQTLPRGGFGLCWGRPWGAARARGVARSLGVYGDGVSFQFVSGQSF